MSALATPSSRKAAALTNQGVALQSEQRFAEALALYDEALALDTTLAATYYNRAISKHWLGKGCEEVTADFRRAAALEPNNIPLLMAMGRKLFGFKYHLEGIAFFHQAATLDPSNEDAWIQLADGNQTIGNRSAAEQMYAYILQRFPHNNVARLHDALFMPTLANDAEDIEHLRTRFTQKITALMQENFVLENPTKNIRNGYFYTHYHGKNQRPLAELYAQFLRAICPSLHYTATHCTAPRKAKGEKIRLGFVSPSMHERTLNQFLLKVLYTLRDRDDFEVIVFSNAPVDLMVEHIQTQIEYVVLPNDLERSRDMIADARMDVLLYPEIGAKHFITFLAHMRLAPVQCAWGGIAFTTGIPTIDYYLSNADGESENAQEFYSEKLILLSRTVCVYSKPYISKSVPSRASLGLPTHPEMKLYACPVQLFKLHPDMDQIFADILARDDKAMILLFTKQTLVSHALQERLKKHVPQPYWNRIAMLPYVSYENFPHMLRAVDCVMDTLYYSFGTTAYLCFAANVPFVTLPDPILASRAGLRMYNHIGVTDTIAKDKNHFVELCVKLANDKAFRDDLVERISAKSDVFFDDYAIVDEFADTLQTLYFDPPQ